MPRTRRRRGARVRVRHPAFFEADGHKGPATLREISYSGARFEADPSPPPQAEVRVYVWPPGQAEPFELEGTVVGEHEDGFALEFENVGQHTCHCVDVLQATGKEPEPPPQEELGGER